MLWWAESIQSSRGVKLPMPLAKKRRRDRVMRPLTVRMEKGSAPLLWRRLPVRGWVGGGGSRLGGFQAELDGGLVGVLPEAGEQIADLLLALGDDAAGCGGVDGSRNIPAELLELLM